LISTIRNAWKIEELRKKILFTLLALLIFRLGSVIPAPFVDGNVLKEYLKGQSGTIFTLLNAMSGDAFAQATVFALSIQPYINSSIIIELLCIAIPALERLKTDGGEEGRKKIAAITRYTTVAIAVLQGFGYFTLLNSWSKQQTALGGSPILNMGTGVPVWLMGIIIVLAFTAGSAFLMWLGEQITEFGIGNGISIILFGGIVSRVPSMVMGMITGVQNWSHNNKAAAEAAAAGTEASLRDGAMHPALIPLFLVGMLLLVIFIVFITNAERRIPVQYAKRVVGRKMYGGQSTHLPMKVNMSGVMPIIFAQAIASLPATIAAFAGVTKESKGFGGGFMRVFDSSGVLYAVVYFLLILGFSYFYSSIQFNPVEVANNLKKNGGFVPGFRPGKPTADFIHKVLNKITLFGALYLSVIAILPIITGNIIGIQSLAIGGTSIIIVVGVALETVKAMEAQMLMRHYKGFLE
jgi:preprotein translocase subunit SecY